MRPAVGGTRESSGAADRLAVTGEGTASGDPNRILPSDRPVHNWYLGLLGSYHSAESSSYTAVGRR